MAKEIKVKEKSLGTFLRDFINVRRLKEHMRWKTMVDKKQLEEVYKQNLENDIINAVSEMKGLDLRKAFDIYYSSKLAEQILNDSYGIENMDSKYLAEDLIENESELF